LDFPVAGGAIKNAFLKTRVLRPPLLAVVGAPPVQISMLETIKKARSTLRTTLAALAITAA
jgi:hypothetical protein